MKIKSSTFDLKLLTANQVIKKYKGKFVNLNRHYDYSTKTSLFEVISVKSKICENHNEPEIAISYTY